MKKTLLFLFVGIQQLAFAQTGVVWSATQDIAAASFGNMHPRVAVDGAGNPMVLWGNANAKKTYFSRWNGTGFTTPALLNPASIPISSASWTGPDLAARGDTVYVAFKHTPEDTNHIYVVHSFNGGVDFSPPVRVEYIGDNNSRFPSLAVDQAGHPLVAFMKFDLGFSNARYVVARSTDYGESFGPEVLASEYSGGDVCDCCPASIVSSGNTVATLYRDNLNNLRNTWAGISSDGGNTFPAGIQLDNTDWVVNSCPASGPDGVLIGDTLYSTFMSAASGKSLCYWSKLSLSGGVSSAAVPITGNFTGLALQNFSRMANSGAATAIVWKQTVNNAAQLAMLFTGDVTQGFPANYELVADNNVINADVALHNGTVYVVWESMNSGTVKFRKGTYSTTGIDENTLTKNDLSVFPNPVSDGVLMVRFEENTNTPLEFSVKNGNGQEVLRQYSIPENGLFKIDVSALAGGFYYLKVSSGKMSTVVKFVNW